MSEDIQKLKDENQVLRSELDVANSKIQAAHQVIIEHLNTGLDLRAASILVNSTSQKMQRESTEVLNAKQKVIEALQEKVRVLTAANAATLDSA